MGKGMRTDDMKVKDPVRIDKPELYLESLGIDDYCIDAETKRVYLPEDAWLRVADNMGIKVYQTMRNFPKYGWWWCR